MWSRVVEVMLGVWLVISPFIFSYPPEKTGWWVNDLTTGTLVILFGLFSYWKPTHLAHLLTIFVGCWLMGFAYSQGFGEPPAAMQNNLILGLMLLMFAVIPNDADRPPQPWDENRWT